MLGYFPGRVGEEERRGEEGECLGVGREKKRRGATEGEGWGRDHELEDYRNCKHLSIMFVFTRIPE